jgi:hypothetical protein
MTEEHGPVPPPEVLVRSPSAVRESAGVVQGCVVITILAVLIGAAHRPADGVAAALNPWQKPVPLEPPETQRVYRELLSALEEALRERTPAGGWPSTAKLSQDLVAPFWGNGAWQWEFRHFKSVVNYIGHPAPGAERPAFLLHIQEDVPHPLNTSLDEFHRRADDGALIHVGIWMDAGARRFDGVVMSPEREGWTELVSGRPPTVPGSEGR